MRRAFSTSVFARHDGQILLIFHKRLSQWLPVGGELQPGETPLEGAQRELLEETGLTGTFSGMGAVEGSPAGLIGYEEHMAGSKGLHLNFCFVAEVPHRDIQPNHEFEKYTWVTAPPDNGCPLNVHQLVQLALHQGEGLASRWIAAFNGRDINALLALYDEQAVHVSPKLRQQRPHSDGALHGKQELYHWWTGAFARLPHLTYMLNHSSSEAGRVWMHYDRVNPDEPTYPVAELLILNERGLIARSEVFHG